MTQQTHHLIPMTQPTPYTCVHACLSMVTGADLDELIERFGDRPLGAKEETTVLIEHGIFPVHTTGQLHEFPFGGVYLVSTASLNMPGKLHLVVVLAREDGYRVIDPNAGREGVEVYGDEDLLAGNLARCEVTYLDFSMLEDMRLPARQEECAE